MKKTLSIVLSFVMLFTLVFSFPFAEENKDVKEIVILHTNDTHSRAQEDEKGKAIGFAKLKTYLESINDKKNTIVLDAGDTLHGKTFATLSRGESIVKLMNEVGYSAMAPGNHDYNYGYDRLVELSKKANFPFLAANVVRDNGKRDFKENTIIEVNGVKIGLFGLCTPETLFKSAPANTKGIKFINPIDCAKEEVKALKGQGAQVIIAIGHLGLDNSTKEEYRSEGLVKAVDGIDIFIDGHSHTALQDGKRVNDTLIAQTGEYFHNIGKVVIKVQDGKVIDKSASLVDFQSLKDQKGDLKVLGMIEQVEKDNKPFLEKIVGKTKVELDGKREHNRAMETNLGNLITDAMRQVAKADVAITNGGGIRETIKMGDVKMGDVLTTFPFTNYTISLKVTGEDIVKALENGVSKAPALDGRFPQVSGLTFKFDPSKEPGSRVFDVMVGKNPIDLKKEYTLATNDFMATGGDGYEMFKGKVQIGQFELLSETLAKYFAANGEIEPKVEGRIISASKDNKAEEKGFMDINNHWAKDYINYVTEKGYFAGLTKEKFGPEENVTRAMLVTVIGRYEKVDPAKYTQTKFSDVKGNEYYGPYVAWAAENKIVAGYEDGSFKPNKEISRAEMAAIFARYQKDFKKVEIKEDKKAEFNDMEKFPAWAKEDILNCAKLGIITGFKDNSKKDGSYFFDPTGSSTRAQLSSIMYHLDNK